MRKEGTIILELITNEVEMLSKLFKGELSLAATFWKFGILGLFILRYVVVIFGNLLAGHLQGRSIHGFFLHHFHPIYSSKLSILWTLCYLSGLLVLAVYSWNITVAVWRSSEAYDKSNWLTFLSRLGIVCMVVAVWSSVLHHSVF